MANLIACFAMPQKQKINRDKVNAALNTRCTKCGCLITPAQIVRVDSQQIQCPECGERFILVRARGQADYPHPYSGRKRSCGKLIACSASSPCPPVLSASCCSPRVFYLGVAGRDFRGITRYLPEACASITLHHKTSRISPGGLTAPQFRQGGSFSLFPLEV